jgi:autotransporter-associated beta strand protein
LGGSATVSFTANSSNNTTRSLVLGGTGGNALKNSGSGALVWSGNVINNTTANGADFTLGGSGTGGNEFSGLLTNNGANTMRLIKNDTGTWKVSGANTFSGLMDLFNGTMQATTISNTGSASSLGTGGTIRFGGFSGQTGVLEYVGSGSTNNKQFKLGGGGTANTGGTILNNGSGALAFNNAAFNLVGDGGAANINRALTLGGTNTADNTISGRIQNNTNFTNSTVSVVKDGTGKWILSGANTYTGGTTVSNGVLELGQTGSLGFVIQGTGTNNQIDGTGTLSLKGKFDFDLTGAATNLNSAWTIVSNSLTTSYGSIFSVNGFSGAGGNWTKITNGVAYVFTQTNGVLSVKLPITWAVSSSLNFGYDGNAQLPLITPTGSTGALTYSFVGIDGTSYSGNSAPSAPGRYKVTASVASDGTYAPGSQDVYFTIGNFSAFRDFWWNGLVSSTVGANSPNQLEDWLNISKASVQGRSLGTPNKSNSWSYGTVNCTGGTPTDLYPTSINGFVDNGRASWQQFWDATLNNNAIYANGPPLWTYRASGAEIGWYGSAWFSDAPGFDGAGAGRNGLSTAANSNTRYLWLRVGGSAYDGVAPAVRWTAPADGTYRFQGEFLPGGNTVAANSTMAVSILTANNPDLPDNEPQTLLPRTVVANDGSPLPFDYVRTVVKGQTVTWLVGADGNNSGDVMGLQAEVTQVIPITLSGVTVGNKDYDGTTTATLQGTPVLNGIAEGSSVSLANLLASFNSPEPGLQAVTITAELAGADAGYYSLSLPTDLSATINTVSTVPTFAGAYPDKNPLAINPANGLSYLMNYALGGTGPTSNPALPVLTSSGTSLTLTANIRDSGQGVDVVGEYTYDLAGDWTEVVLTPPMGASSSVENTTVHSFSINVEPGQPRKFMRLKATKNP